MLQRYKTRIFILLFVVMSLSVSVYTLFQQSLRLDEAQSLWVSTKSVAAIIQYIVLDVHVPLYELLLHFWLQIFGVSIIAARSLSLLFFLLTLPVLYIVIKKSSNSTIALLTIALYSMSPFILWYSFEARMYTLFTFITVVSHYYFLKMLRSNGKTGEVGYFFSLLFGLYTHYFFVLLIAAQGVFLLAYHFQNYKQHESTVSLGNYIKWHKSEILAFFSPVFLAFLFFVPWLIYFESTGLAANTQPLIPEVNVYNLFQTVVNFIFGFPNQTIQSVLVALWPLAVIPIFFLFTKRNAETPIKNMMYFILVTMVPVLLAFFASYFKPIYLTRYLILVTPSFFFLLAWALFHISRQLSAIVLTLFAFLMFGFVLVQNISNSTPVKEDYAQVTDDLNNKVTPGDIVAITSPFTIYPIEYYYKNSAKIVTIPDWDVYKSGAIPQYATTNLAKQIKSYQGTYNDLYVVLSYDQGYQGSIEKYLDTHYKRLMLKNYSPGLQLREYQLRY